MSLRRILKVVDALLLQGAVLCFAAFLVSVCLQVVFRYVLEKPLPWIEEAAVHLFIWSSFLTAAVITGRNEHFVIDFYSEWLPPSGDRFLSILSTALSLLFVGIVVYHGTVWSVRMLPARTAVLQMSQGAVYMVIPFAALYMGVHLIVRLTTFCGAAREARRGPC